MKLLILTVPSGGGHVQAARALEEAARELYPQINVTNINALDYAAPAARLAYQKSYLALIKYLPALWGLLYNHSDNLRAKKLIDLATRKIQTINAQPLINFIKDWQPQAILSTHFFDNFVLHNLFKTGELTCPWYTVITDFYPHPLWLNEFCWQYFVAAPATRQGLLALQVPSKKIKITGIPLRQQFLKTYARQAVCQKYGLNPNRPVILALAGGFGLGDLATAVKLLASLKLPVQIVAVAGDNPSLEKKLRQIKTKNGQTIIVLGQVANMAELMSAAAIAVTKAGGVTISECLAMGLPIVIASPIPGQEKTNSQFLLQHRAAKVLANFDELTRTIYDLLNNPRERATLSAAAKKISRPSATADILNIVSG